MISASDTGSGSDNKICFRAVSKRGKFNEPFHIARDAIAVCKGRTKHDVVVGYCCNLLSARNFDLPYAVVGEGQSSSVRIALVLAPVWAAMDDMKIKRAPTADAAFANRTVAPRFILSYSVSAVSESKCASPAR